MSLTLSSLDRPNSQKWQNCLKQRTVKFTVRYKYFNILLKKKIPPFQHFLPQQQTSKLTNGAHWHLSKFISFWHSVVKQMWLKITSSHWNETIPDIWLPSALLFMTAFCSHYMEVFWKGNTALEEPIILVSLVLFWQQTTCMRGSRAACPVAWMEECIMIKIHTQQLNPPRALLEQGLQLKKSCLEML